MTGLPGSPGLLPSAYHATSPKLLGVFIAPCWSLPTGSTRASTPMLGMMSRDGTKGEDVASGEKESATEPNAMLPPPAPKLRFSSLVMRSDAP